MGKSVCAGVVYIFYAVFYQKKNVDCVGSFFNAFVSIVGIDYH